MSSSAHVSPVARRYGRALFEAAREGGSLNEVRADMQQLATVFADADAAAVLSDPRVEQQRKGALLRSAFGGKLHAHSTALLGVLETRNRLALLPQIPAAFEELLDQHEGRLRGVLESALPVDDASKQRLETALGTSTGKTVLLETKVQEDLLGGVRVTLAGTRFDGSARGRLEKLQLRLASVEL